MAFAVVASKRARLAVADLLKTLLLAPSAASASRAAPTAAALRPACAAAARRLSTGGGGAPSRGDGLGLDSEQECSGFSVPMSPATKETTREPVCMDRLMKVAALAADEAASRGCCGFWVLTEEVDKVKLKVAMPGLGKEHVKVWAEQDGLVVEAEGDRDTEFDDDGEDPARYSYRMTFPEGALKMDHITAEMKHGRLKVTVPKIKVEEEPTDVFQVKIWRRARAQSCIESSVAVQVS